MAETLPDLCVSKRTVERNIPIQACIASVPGFGLHETHRLVKYSVISNFQNISEKNLSTSRQFLKTQTYVDKK